MTALVTAVCLVVYYLGYAFYARYLSRRVFLIDPHRPTPAHTLRDEVDYVPTRKLVLFGHHYASITGLSPMLGPAVAVIWGWAPAMLWVVAGALLVGCVHDFGALVVSMRARGMSIGKVTEGIVGPRAKTLFHLIIFFGIALAMGVFVYVIALMFAITPQWDPQRPLADPSSFPTAVLPSAVLIVIAVVVGNLAYRRGWRLAPLTVAGFVVMLVSVWAGVELPTLGLAREAWPERSAWVLILLAYSFIASVLPVWSLLQARDFLNSLLLYLGLGMAYLGLFVGAPEFAAPAFRMHPEGAPSFLPFVFIIIACGAASGFHSLVSSGTTAKQIDNEGDARFIGYGGMIGESMLGLLAVVACTAAGVTGTAGTARAAGSTPTPTGARCRAWGSRWGCSSPAPPTSSSSSASSTSAPRRRWWRWWWSPSRSPRSIRRPGCCASTSPRWARRCAPAGAGPLRVVGAAVGVIAFFAFYEIGGKAAGLALWRLFGTTNQLLAGLALLAVSLYLYQRGRNYWVTALPCLFMLVSTLFAMVANLRDFWAQRASGGGVLFAIGLVLLGLAVWLLVESVASFLRFRGRAPLQSMEVPLEDAG